MTITRHGFWHKRQVVPASWAHHPSHHLRHLLAGLLGLLDPALCGQRLSLLPSGDVVFTLKRARSDGTQFLIFTPMELLEKLAVLVPPPGRHLVTYHGVLSSAARWRKLIIPDSQAEAVKAEIVEPAEPVLPEPEPDSLCLALGKHPEEKGCPGGLLGATARAVAKRLNLDLNPNLKKK